MKLNLLKYLLHYVKVPFYKTAFLLASISDEAAYFNDAHVPGLEHGLQTVDDLCSPDFM